jgi:hypothetical protein
MKTTNMLVVVALMIFFIFINLGFAAQWVLCVSDSSGARLYYDKSSIKKVNKNVMRVLNKFEYISKNNKKMAYTALKQVKKAPKNPDMMSYDLSVSEIDCANNKHRLVSATFYDVKGKAIYSSSKPEKYWNRIFPDSYMGKVKTAVCPSCKSCKSKKE